MARTIPPMMDNNLGVLAVAEDDDGDNDDFPCEEFLPIFPTLLFFDLFFLAMVDFEAQCYCNGEMERIFQRNKNDT